MKRVVVYIDGFNLYYGLRDAGWRRYYWLDLRRLSENLLRPDQRLVLVRYFTARVFLGPAIRTSRNGKVRIWRHWQRSRICVFMKATTRPRTCTAHAVERPFSPARRR